MSSTIKQAMDLCASAQYEEAERLCRRLLKRNAKQHEAMHILAILQAKKRRL